MTTNEKLSTPFRFGELLKGIGVLLIFGIFLFILIAAGFEAFTKPLPPSGHKAAQWLGWALFCLIFAFGLSGVNYAIEILKRCKMDNQSYQRALDVGRRNQAACAAGRYNEIEQPEWMTKAWGDKNWVECLQSILALPFLLHAFARKLGTGFLVLIIITSIWLGVVLFGIFFLVKLVKFFWYL